jgi:hypothetical protein
MAYKTVVELDADQTVSLGGQNKKTGKKNPIQVEGYYIGKKEVDSPKSKSGKAFLYILQTPKGNLGVWGKTDMDRKMKGAVPGHMLRITHTGMQATKNGEMYKYSVEFDSENTIEVTGGDDVDSTLEGSGDDFDGGVYAEGGLDEGAEEEEQEETQVPLVAKSAAARAAAVQELLSRGKASKTK